jgi:transposase
MTQGTCSCEASLYGTGLRRHLRLIHSLLIPQEQPMRIAIEAGTHSPWAITLEDPYRFEKSRSVGAYLGLVPATDRSGERDPQKHISKEGDEMLRKLLVGSAHYILGPFGSDSDLRRHGEKIASRGGKNAKKRAAVAVARKLSVLLHRLWVSGEVYDPLYNAHRREQREAAA